MVDSFADSCLLSALKSYDLKTSKSLALVVIHFLNKWIAIARTKRQV